MDVQRKGDNEIIVKTTKTQQLKIQQFRNQNSRSEQKLPSPYRQINTQITSSQLDIDNSDSFDNHFNFDQDDITVEVQDI